MSQEPSYMDKTKKTTWNQYSESNRTTFSTLWANSENHKLMIFSYFFPENWFWHFMQIVSNGDNLHEMSYPVFWEKYKNYLKL